MAPIIDPERLYTIRQAAVFLGIVPGAVWDRIRRGALPGTKAADGRWRIGGAVLLRLLAQAEAANRAQARRRADQPAIDPAAWYGRREAARTLGLTQQAVYSRIRRGALPAAKTEAGWRIRGADLLAALDRAAGEANQR